VALHGGEGVIGWRPAIHPTPKTAHTRGGNLL